MFPESTMSNKSPIFPMHFDPQSHYFQVLEEARKHKQEKGGHNSKHQIQKPIFQENYNVFKKKKKMGRSKQWLKNAFRFFRAKLKPIRFHTQQKINGDDHLNNLGGGDYTVRASVSGPIYMTESRSSGPYYRTRRSSSGPVFLMGDNIIPYISLREVKVDQQSQSSAASSMPIYLVT